MTLSRTWAIALSGLAGHLVEVEADLSAQTPDFRIIGLADKAIGEAHQRVHNACANTGTPLPPRRLTVNLSPAALPKQGAGFDLAIAVAALATAYPLDPGSVTRTAHVGELGLDGRLRAVAGILPAVVASQRAGMTRVIVPLSAAGEASLVEGIEVIAVGTLRGALRVHGAEFDDDDAPDSDSPEPAATGAGGQPAPPVPELAEVIGQDEAVDALVVAAAGRHHLMLGGSPGVGKTMLAERLPGILPDLDEHAAIQVACIRSLSGVPVTALDRTPPFEAPHHTASVASLVGGGSRVVRPGSVARASGGVLFLDEAAEFGAHALDCLRQPMETRAVDIHRAGVRARFPADFQLVLATNPCPCGKYGLPGGECSCPSLAVRRYLGRLSGPLRDRIDIDVTVPRPLVSDITGVRGAVTTSAAKERVAAARARSRQRLSGTPWTTNAEVSGAWLRTGPAAPDGSVRRPLDEALRRGALSLRGYDRVLRVAWSVADLAARDRLTSAGRRQSVGAAGDGMTVTGTRETSAEEARDALAGTVSEQVARDDDAVRAAYARACWLVLAEPGDSSAGALIRERGPADALHYARRMSASPTRGTSDDLRRAIARWAPRIVGLDAWRDRARRAGLTLVVPEDVRWPCRVDDLGDHAPLGLWTAGNPDLWAWPHRTVAIVGARAATSYGVGVASDFGAGLAAAGVGIISGAAFGIDVAAHRGALAGDGFTTAVLAGGADLASPRAHAQLLGVIAARGLVASEIPPGGEPTRWRFLQRNRIIAALADATVVVEAGWRSGSLNTAGHAAALGRPLGAVPGPVTSAASMGCHRLLREYDATCVTSVDDVRELLGLTSVVGGESHREHPDRTRLLDALTVTVPRTVTEIAARSGLSLNETQSLLGQLSLDGTAARTATGWVKRTAGSKAAR